MRLITAAVLAAAVFTIADAALAAMSIDLGSQYIKIALVKTGVPMEIVLNKESRRKTPNTLGFKGDERFFADAAMQLALKQPKNTYPYLLELIGKKDSDPAVARYKSQFPFNEFTSNTRGVAQFKSGENVYDVETLMAMILWSAKKTTEAYAEQSVKDVVITVPAFFNQAERRAIAIAAEIAGLNLLQILNCGSAAALNYGVFRRKEITEQSSTMLIYDMGSLKTEATIVEYQLVEDKDKLKNPVLRTLGYGFDRSLGGLEMTLRVQKHLENVFRKEKKTPTDIATNARSMSKLHKEAERVKQILSANTNTFAQIENVHEDTDFRTEVTRELFESLIADLDERIAQPIKDALAMAEMEDMSKIDQIVLMGGGSRVPRVKSVLSTAVGGKELGNFLNTDEAIAMGAVYQSAKLSKSFKVLTFNVEEPILYPVKIDFESQDEQGNKKAASKVLFGYKTAYPANKKIVTLNSYSDDFTFTLNYGDLHLNQEQISEFGASSLYSISVSEVKDKMTEALAGEGSVFKGFKVHVRIDDSGIVSVEKVELNAEQPPPPKTAEEIAAEEEEARKEEEKKKEEEEEKKKEEEAKKEEEKKEDGEKTDDKKEEKKEEKKKDEKKEEEKKKKKKEEPKPKKIRMSMAVKAEHTDLALPNAEEIEVAKKILADFEAVETAKQAREESQNALEATLYDLHDKLDTKEGVIEFMTEEEREKLSGQVSLLRTWMEDEAGFETTKEEFDEKKKSVDEITEKGRGRMTESLAFPQAKADLDSLFNSTDLFLTLAKNMTKKDDTDEENVFTQTEIEVLSIKYAETQSWLEEKIKAVEKAAKHEEPAVTKAEIDEKGIELQREVKYLYSKMTSFKPKVKKSDKKGNETTTDGESKTEESTTEEPKESEEPKEEKKEDVHSDL